MAELMQRGSARARFNNADDLEILGIGRTVAESATVAQQEVDSLLEWANTNAISLDTEKSELI